MICVQCSTPLTPGTRVCPQCHALQPVAVQRVGLGPGATIDLGYGRVVIQARLGEGGMGVVWRAWLFFAPGGPHGSEGPLPLALKVLTSRADAQPAMRALFVREAEALKSLHHPNIVRFQDFFDWGGALALSRGARSRTSFRAIARGRRSPAAAPTGAFPSRAPGTTSNSSSAPSRLPTRSASCTAT
jgi:serine/threonine protein kinase